MPGRALDRGELEVAALDGGHLERLADLGAQRQQAPADGVAHAVGQRQRSPSGWSMRPWATSRRTTSSE